MICCKQRELAFTEIFEEKYGIFIAGDAKYLFGVPLGLH